MKYSKKEIMKRAWMIRRAANVSMSIAMKASWATAKAEIMAEELGGRYCGHTKVASNDWVKYGKNRTYVSARVYTNAWNLKHEIKVGYVDNLTGEFVAA